VGSWYNIFIGGDLSFLYAFILVIRWSLGCIVYRLPGYSIFLSSLGRWPAFFLCCHWLLVGYSSFFNCDRVSRVCSESCMSILSFGVSSVDDDVLSIVSLLWVRMFNEYLLFSLFSSDRFTTQPFNPCFSSFSRLILSRTSLIFVSLSLPSGWFLFSVFWGKLFATFCDLPRAMARLGIGYINLLCFVFYSRWRDSFLCIALSSVLIFDMIDYFIVIIYINVIILLVYCPYW